MSADLGQCVGRAVAVVTCDGRVIVGLLEGFDQTMNVVLSACHERVFSRERPVAVAQLGTYLVRGENVALVGPVEEDLDASVDYATLCAPPIAPVTH